VAKTQEPGRIREENSQLILSVAEQAFVKHGFKGTSMQAIADAAKLPKANLHYYFGSKSALYSAVLAGIVQRWDAVVDDVDKDADPAEVLERYICAKVDLSIESPAASKIFAMEIIQGGPYVMDHMKTSLRDWFRDKTDIFQSWIDQGKMADIDPEHLIFMIWSTTQHYADFDAQILTLTNKPQYEPEDVEKIKDFLCRMILAGCGLTSSRV
jgi:TetR/AcrR family transcriptional regulator